MDSPKLIVHSGSGGSGGTIGGPLPMASLNQTLNGLIGEVNNILTDRGTGLRGSLIVT